MGTSGQSIRRSLRSRRSRSRLAALPLAVALVAAAPGAGFSASGEVEAFSDYDQLNLSALLGRIVTASKHEQSLAETPAAVTVFGASDIERFGWLTLADVLRSTPGLYVSYDRVYEYVGVRGFSRPGDFNSRILVLLDGHPIQEGWYGSAAIGYAAGFDLTGVRRIEIVRGPGSVLYGTNAFFGVVNVVTMGADEIGGVAVETGAGSLGTVAGRARVGHTFSRGGAAVLIGSVTRSDGRDLSFPEFEATYGTSLAEDADYLRAGSAFAKYTSGPLVLRAAYGAREKGMPTAPYGAVFGDPRNRAVDRRGFLEAAVDKPVSKALDLTVRGYVDYSSYDDFILVPPADPDSDDVFRDDALNTWGGLEVRLGIAAPERLRTTIGGEFQANHFTLDAYLEESQDVFINDRRDYTTGAVYLQNEIRLHDRLRAEAGVRLESHSEFGGVTVPRVGLLATLPGGVRGKLLYGESFRSPNLAEAYFDDGSTIAANPNLRREHAATREAILEKEIGSGQIVAVSVYETKIRDLIDQRSVVVPEYVDPGAGDDGVRLQAQNTQAVEAHGAEIRYEASLRSGVRLFGGIALSRARDVSGSEEVRLENSPEHVASFGIARSFLDDRLSVAMSGEMVDDRLTFRESPQAVPGHTIANINLRYRTEDGIHVSLSSRNVTNVSFADPIGQEHVPDRMPQDGRTIEVRVGYGF